jgi:hypothetical protein
MTTLYILLAGLIALGLTVLFCWLFVKERVKNKEAKDMHEKEVNKLHRDIAALAESNARQAATLKEAQNVKEEINASGSPADTAAAADSFVSNKPKR